MPLQPVDALILGGGQFDEASAAVFGTRTRALAQFRGKPFIEWTIDALHECPHVGRIGVVGADGLRDGPWAARVSCWVSERAGIVENLLAGMEALDGRADLLVAPSDNPLLPASAFTDFIDRSPTDAGLAYPYLPHAAFLARFPSADNIPLRLGDGTWIGGGCVLARGDARGAVRQLAEQVLNARKSKWKMVGLLGPGFVLKFALHRATVADVTARASAILGAPVCFVPDCAPEFAIDIDEPVDLEYIERWAGAHLSS